MKLIPSVISALAAGVLTTSTFAQSPATTITPASAAAEVGISSHDGITISGDDVLITRNGISEKLTKKIELPNGIRVMPDGAILSREGEKLTLRPTQILTLDGRFITVPIRESAPQKSTVTTSVETAPAAVPEKPLAPKETAVIKEAPGSEAAEAERAAKSEAERRARAAKSGGDQK